MTRVMHDRLADPTVASQGVKECDARVASASRPDVLMSVMNTRCAVVYILCCWEHTWEPASAGHCFPFTFTRDHNSVFGQYIGLPAVSLGLLVGALACGCAPVSGAMV